MGTQNKLINGKNDVCDQYECVDDQTHILSCQAPLATEYKEELLIELATSLDKLDTHPNLVTLVLHGGRNINGCVLLDVTGHPE